MSGKVSVVKNQYPVLEVSDVMRKAGYCTADSCGAISTPNPNDQKIGVLLDGFRKSKPALVKLIDCGHPDRLFLGTLEMNTEKAWHFYFYGSQNVLLARQFAELIAEKFNVDVEIENTQTENVWEEYYER